MTLFQAFGQFAGAGGGAAAGAPGMVLLTPTSITNSGGSATTGANGQVTFSGITALNINGVFSADFDNYMMLIRHVGTGGDNNILGRLRASGTDSSANYKWQYGDADGSTFNKNRFTSASSWRIGAHYTSQYCFDLSFIYGPYLAQPTAYRLYDASSYNGAAMYDAGGTHSLSTQYDGISLIPTPTASIAGAVQIYGIRS